MKYKLELTRQYLKDLKLARKRGLDEDNLNEIILKFHDDFCTIRRDMICEHIMEKNIFFIQQNGKRFQKKNRNQKN